MGCALALAACVGYEPAPLEPEVELALLRGRGAEAVTADAEPLAPTSRAWFPLERDVVPEDGLSLAEANALALFWSPRVVAARQSADVAGAQVLQSGLLDNPQLFFGPRWTTTGAHLIMPAQGTWNLPIWGEQSAERDLATAQWSQQRWQVVTVELEVLRDVRLGYLDFAARRAELAAREALVASSQQLVAWVERLEAAGQVDAVTRYLAQLQREQARMNAADARLAQQLARTRLLGLIGLMPTSPVEIDAGSRPFELPELPAADPAVLVAHPELRARQAAYRASEGALRVEIARQYPAINLGPQYEYDEGLNSWGFGIGVELPVFDRNRGAIAAAEHRRDVARTAYRNALLALSQREAVARAQLQAAETQLSLYREATQSQVEAMQVALPARLRSGLSSVLEVITAQVTLTSVRVRAIQLVERAAAARLRAAVAAGTVVAADPAVIEGADPETAVPERPESEVTR